MFVTSHFHQKHEFCGVVKFEDRLHYSVTNGLSNLHECTHLECYRDWTSWKEVVESASRASKKSQFMSLILVLSALLNFTLTKQEH